MNIVAFYRYKVYQIIPRAEEDAHFLRALNDAPEFDFWAQPRALNASVTVMVSPEAQASFVSDLRARNMDFDVLIENVER